MRNAAKAMRHKFQNLAEKPMNHLLRRQHIARLGYLRGLLERRANTLNGRRTGYRGKHAAPARDRVAQVGVGGGKLGTHVGR